MFYQPEIDNGVHFLTPEESKHCTRVLRKKAGDVIQLADGKGNFYQATIVSPDSARCTFEILGTEKEKKTDFTIHIGIAPTKNTDRIEWFVEKAVEIGVNTISFIRCQNSERPSLKIERIRKLAVSAMKQSQRATLPQINDITDFNQFVGEVDAQQKFIAHVDDSNQKTLLTLCRPSSKILVLIGPEGDFTPDEIKLSERHNLIKVSLGDHRLRTETAGIVACHTIHLVNQLSSRNA